MLRLLVRATSHVEGRRRGGPPAAGLDDYTGGSRWSHRRPVCTWRGSP